MMILQFIYALCTFYITELLIPMPKDTGGKRCLCLLEYFTRILFASIYNLPSAIFLSYTEFVCGGAGSFTTSPGYLQSPKYSGTYLNNMVCKWTIVAPSGYFIKVTFESFVLEYSTDCVNDRLEIFDDHRNSLGRLDIQRFAAMI